MIQQRRKKIQNVAVMMYVRFKVTICLYLIPNTEREVVPRLWQSTSAKTLHIMHSLICRLRPLRVDKDSGVIRVCEMEIDPAATDKIQNVAVMIHVRFRVTVCLYLIPNNRARSLSTLMAVKVNKDTPHNV